MQLFRNARTRLIAMTAAVSCLISGVALGLLYVTANTIIENETRSVVNAELSGLADDYRSLGVLGLARAIESRLEDAQRRDAVYLLTDAQGRTIAGNLGGWPPTVEPGGGWVELELIRTDRNRSVPISAASFELVRGERLLVGRDASGLVRFDQALVRAGGLALVAALILSIASGWLLTRLVFSRLTEISDTAQEIVSGDLSRRIPIRGTGDELDRLGVTLNEMLARIDGLVGNLRMTTDSLAHDLRSPLTRLAGQLRKLEEGDLTENERSAAVTRAEAEITHLLQVLSDLTEISRAEAGLGRSEFEPVDLNQLVVNAAELYGPVAEEKGVGLSYTGDVSPIAGHAPLLTQALSNLIENALRYAPESSEIQISLAESPNENLVQVRDQGPGIDPASLTDVTRPFVTLDASRTEPHSGLGLALVSAVAGLHGGELELRNNTPGPGLSAEIRFPKASTTN